MIEIKLNDMLIIIKHKRQYSINNKVINKQLLITDSRIKEMIDYFIENNIDGLSANGIILMILIKIIQKGEIQNDDN